MHALQSAVDLAEATARKFGGARERLEAGGRLLEGGGPRLIRSGGVRLFAALVQEDGGMGRRTHLFDVGAGRMLFPAGETSSGRGKARVALLATPLGDAEFVALPEPAVRELAESGTSRQWLADELDRWIESWHLALAEEAIAPPALELRPNESLGVPEAAAVRTDGSVLWIRASMPGADRYFRYRASWNVRGSRIGVELGGAAAFPLGIAGRLECPEAVTLAAENTSDWWQGDPEWSGLDRFHEIALSALLLLREEEDEAERERLRQRADNEARLLGRAVAKLLEAHEGAPPITAEGADAGGALLSAVRAIGEHMGMEVRAAYAETEDRGPQALKAIAEASGFRVRQVKLEDDWFRRDNGPLLAFAEEDGRPLALIPRRPGRYAIVDPAGPSVEPLTEEGARRLEEAAFTFYRPLPKRELKLADIVKLAVPRGAWRDIAVMLAVGVVIGLLGLFAPVATGILFDSVIPEADRSRLVEMAFVLLGASAASFLFELARGIAVMRLEGRGDLTLQAAIWDRLLRLPVSFFRRYSAGDLAMRANSINAIRRQLSGIALSTLFSGLFSSFNLLLLFRYDTGIALIALGLVAIGILASAGFAYAQIRYQREMMKDQGQLSSLMLHLLSGIAKFRIAAAESRAFYLWARLFGSINRTGFRINRLQAYFSVYQAIFPIATSMALFYNVASMGEGRLSTGHFIAFFAAFSSFLSAMLAMSSSLLSIMGVVTLYERAKPILQALPEETEGGEDPGPLGGSIELNRVRFRYDKDGAWIVRDVSLAVKPGSFVAIVGESGSGKSTLVRLLLGFEKPESGSILYDGKELGSLDVRAVRRQIGVVLQNADVMAGNIYENIAGSTGLSVQEAWEAAAMAGLDADIREMPMGMHTVIADGGGTLSGGQKQRLLIARAIVRKPRILFFDEATSALDNRTQAIVSDSLESLQATRIVIAHRLSTIRHADVIAVMSQGRIVQTGTYEELIAEEGEFAKMARRQIV